MKEEGAGKKEKDKKEEEKKEEKQREEKHVADYYKMAVFTK